MDKKEEIIDELIKNRLKAQNVKEPTVLSAMMEASSFIITGVFSLFLVVFCLENLVIEKTYFGSKVIDRSLTFKEPLSFPFPIEFWIIFAFVLFLICVPAIYYVLKGNYDSKARKIRAEILEEQKQQKEAIKEAIREIELDNNEKIKNEIDSLISKLEALKQAKSDKNIK